jgi:hypothetical protein
MMIKMRTSIDLPIQYILQVSHVNGVRGGRVWCPGIGHFEACKMLSRLGHAEAIGALRQNGDEHS